MSRHRARREASSVQSITTADEQPGVGLTARRRHPRGQLLVECLMALVLVSVASLVLVSTSVSMATLGDDALQIARAQREQGNAAGRALLAPCDTALQSALVVRWPSPRLRLDDALDVGGALHRSRSEARWSTSALATNAGRVLRVSGAARCR